MELREPTFSDNSAKNWMVSDVFLSASEKAVYMIANESHVVLYGRVNSHCGNPVLTNLNADDGTIFRGVTAIPSHLGIDHTAYNSDYLYLGYNGTGKAIETSTIGSGGIAAYEINTGEIHWTRIISGTRSMFSLVSSSDVVSVDGGMFPNHYYLVDGYTGEVISALDKFTSGLPGSGSKINTAYWYDHITNNSSPIREPDIQNIALWAERFDRAFQPPVILDNTLLIRHGEGTLLGNVIALDGQNGDVVWETDNNVVSNVAVNDSTVFFLTSSAELIALDVETGHKIGSIQFSNGKILGRDDRGFFVAAAGENVFVYFGDSRQLFSLHFLSDE